MGAWDIEDALQWAVAECDSETPTAAPRMLAGGWRFDEIERYGCFVSAGGTPVSQLTVIEAHPDAKALVSAAAALGRVTVDLSGHLDDLLGPLAAYAPERADGRDIMRVLSFNQGVDVLCAARLRRRPYWQPDFSFEMIEDPRCKHHRRPLVAGRHPTNRRLLPGAYCPLQLVPCVAEMLWMRARYCLWHEALRTLAKGLPIVKGRQLLPPVADPTPWLERNEVPPRILATAA